MTFKTRYSIKKNKVSEKFQTTVLKFQVGSPFETFISGSVYRLQLKRSFLLTLLRDLRLRGKAVQRATNTRVRSLHPWADRWSTRPHRGSSAMMTYHKTRRRRLKLINRKRRVDYAGFSVKSVVGVCSRPRGAAEPVVPVLAAPVGFGSHRCSRVRGVYMTRGNKTRIVFL